MRWPWMSKKKHEAVVSRLLLLLGETQAHKVDAIRELERERAKYPHLRFGRHLHETIWSAQACTSDLQLAEMVRHGRQAELIRWISDQLVEQFREKGLLGSMHLAGGREG